MMYKFLKSVSLTLVATTSLSFATQLLASADLSAKIEPLLALKEKITTEEMHLFHYYKIDICLALKQQNQQIGETLENYRKEYRIPSDELLCELTFLLRYASDPAKEDFLPALRGWKQLPKQVKDLVEKHIGLTYQEIVSLKKSQLAEFAESVENDTLCPSKHPSSAAVLASIKTHWPESYNSYRKTLAQVIRSTLKVKAFLKN